MIIKDELQQISTVIERRIKYVEKELSRCPEGRLHIETQAGKRVPVAVYIENGRRHRKNLIKYPEIETGLVRKLVFEEELKALQNNRKAVEAALSIAADYDLAKVLYELEKTYRSIGVDEFILAACDKAGEKWADSDYEKLDYRSDEKQHITSRGLRVRSKSELLIAEKLYQFGISFRYEQIIHIEGGILAPDFTIRRSDGKLFYWEHQGLTSSDRYIRQQSRKSALYASAGIVPWDNLIITYDDASGKIDLKTIEYEIKSKLII